MENGNRKIGVYVCHCGSNIAGTVDVAAVTDFAKSLHGVAVARNYQYMCSDPGQELIKQDIKELGLDRVVVASCSPTMHERTFREVCMSAGLNPYLFQMANIREHCSWITEDHARATEKAKALVSAAVSRVARQQPLQARTVPVNPNTLVVGGGIAGIQAALEIANSRHLVYLVEKSPSIGGHMAQLDKTFPTLDCSACILTPRMNQAGSHKYIKLMTYSEVVGVSGFVGNFKVKIRRKARFVDESKCTGCGTCMEKCPYKSPSEFDMGLSQRKAIYTPFPQAVPNKPAIDKERCVYFKSGKCQACLKFCKQGAINFSMKDEDIEVEVGNIIVATGYETYDPTPMYQYGYGRLDNVVTALQFERMINASGPTSGRILLKNGKEPKSVAIVHCVGSRDKNIHEYCSQVCCMYSIKFSHLVREHVPGANVYELYIDKRAVGKAYEEFYNRALDEGTNFIRGKPSDIVKSNGNLLVEVEDTLAGCQREIPVDMVVLATAIEPKADVANIARLFSLSRSTDGFFMEKHPKLDPVATMNDGVYVVGCCHGPKDIPHSVVQASAAAARVLGMLSVGTIEIEPITAAINEENCSGCRVCADLCPYNAVSFDAEKKISRVNEALCKGCGTCVAACPSGAITGSHFTTEQIMAEIEGVLV